MFKHPTKTGIRGPFTAMLLSLTLVPMSAPADSPAANAGGTDKTVSTEAKPEPWRASAGAYTVSSIGYISANRPYPDPELNVPPKSPTMSATAAYSPVPEVHGNGGSDELKAVALTRTRARQKVVDWVKARSPAAGAVTYLLVAKPDNGWHLAIDPGDEVMLEWKVTF